MNGKAQPLEIHEIVAALEAAAVALENLGAFAAAAYVSQSLDALESAGEVRREADHDGGDAG